MPIPDYDLIRPDILHALERYVKEHYPVGDFLTAVLANDLNDAFGRADEYNNHTLFHIAAWVHNEVPRAAWGSRQAVKDWVQAQHPEKRKAT